MGLITGLSGNVGSGAAIISSLLLVAVADNLSDSLAIHAYQEVDTWLHVVSLRRGWRCVLLFFDHDD